MKRPAIFFDRDNTLIATNDYLGDPSKVVLINGAADAVARARALGFATVIFSNQSGVARGMFDEAAVHAVNQRLDELLADHNPNAKIDRHEFCPHHPEGTVEAYKQDTDRRKPGAGMITSAAAVLELDLTQSWVIGDAPRDIEAGYAAGCKTILFRDPSLEKSPAADAEQKVSPDYTVSTLAEAIDIIEKSQPKREEASPGGNADTEVTASSSFVRSRPEQSASKTSRPVILTAKLESMAAEILRELRRRHEQPDEHFSVSKLFAGIIQVVVFAVLFIAYLYRNEGKLQPMLLFALTLQTMTVAFLIMGRQR
jgi:D-glycero-D-manno-heptose 1,7-bisphosphate phosphatase